MRYVYVILLAVFFEISVRACSIFCATDGNTVLAGKNVDWKVPECQLKFFPPAAGAHGYVFHCIKYFGNYFTTDGGINDQGLFLEYADILFPRDQDFRVPGEINYTGDLEGKILSSFSTVDEVINFFRTYYTPGFSSAHLMVGDRFGNSVVIERADGDSLAFIRSGKTYQVVTNFLNSYVTDPKMAGFVGCYRYNYIDAMLKDNTNISVDLFSTILDGAANKGQHNPSIYSLIYDLKNLEVYAYVYTNYEEVFKFNLVEELNKGKHSLLLPDQFSNIKGIYPVNGEIVNESTVDISWVGDADEYEILLSPNKDFSNIVSFRAMNLDFQEAGIPGWLVLLLIMSFVLLWKNKKLFLAGIFFLGIAAGCAKDLIELPDTISVIKHTKTIDGLLPGRTYYWKIIATGKNGYKTESKVYNFSTSEF
jgi:hypothetical protein